MASNGNSAAVPAVALEMHDDRLFCICLFFLAPRGGDVKSFQFPRHWTFWNKLRWRLSPAVWVGMENPIQLERDAKNEDDGMYSPVKDDPTTPSANPAVGTLASALAKIILTFLESTVEMRPEVLGAVHAGIFAVFFCILLGWPLFENRSANVGALFLVFVELSAAIAEIHTVVLDDSEDLAPGLVFVVLVFAAAIACAVDIARRGKRPAALLVSTVSVAIAAVISDATAGGHVGSYVVFCGLAGLFLVPIGRLDCCNVLCSDLQCCCCRREAARVYTT